MTFAVLPSRLAATVLLAGAVPAAPPDRVAPPAAGAAAESRAADPALETLVAEALSRNPDLEALRQSLQAAQNRPAQARALADPVVSVAYTNDGWAPSLGSVPMTRLAIMASQDLPWPGKRDLRGRIAAKDAEEAQQQLARGELSVAAQVRRAYVGLLEARALTTLVREQGHVWRQIEGVARARYAVGQVNQQDVVRTQLEQSRIEQLLAEQQLEEELRLAELNRLLARPPDTPLETRAELAAGPADEPLDGALLRLRPRSPELAAAGIAVERARLQLNLARKAYQPDFAVQAGYMNRGGLEPMWQAGVAVTLPVQRGRRAAAVAEAEAQLRAAEARQAASDLQLARRTRERLAQIQTGRRIALLYSEGIVPQARLAVEAAVASYETGRLPFVTVLEALTTLYADRAALVRALGGQRRASISLEEASLEATADVAGAGPGMGGSAGAGMTSAPQAPGMSGMGN